MESEKKDWVDFKKIKEEVAFGDVLQSFGLLEGMNPEGAELVGFCPLHGGEKTKRSFYVNEKKGTFHCFGCRKSGNVLDFVKLHQRVSLKEAGKYLEKFLGEKKEAIESGESLPAADVSPAADPDPADPPGESAVTEKLLLSKILEVLERIEKKVSWLPSK